MKPLDKFIEMSREINRDLSTDSSRKSPKVVGYFCSYIPEEIIAAAGLIPYRMRGVGSDSTELADTYFSSTNCLFPRHILDLALKGNYSFLDGLIFSNSCDHTRRLFDIWTKALPGMPDFVHFIDVPHVIGKIQEKRYMEVLKYFVEQIEKTFNCVISEESLITTIKQYNRRRKLLRLIYQKRTIPNPDFKGSDFLKLMLSITTLPIEKGNELLEMFEKELQVPSENSAAGSVRVALIGGCMEEVSFLELIENSGITIVEDNTCLGCRYFDGDIEETGDLLFNIAQRYLHHLSCPRILMDYHRRLLYVTNTITSGRADAIILCKLPFCILFSGEVHLLKEESRKHRYPLLVIERGYGDKSEGQYKTRIQAFLEEVKNRKGLK